MDVELIFQRGLICSGNAVTCLLEGFIYFFFWRSHFTVCDSVAHIDFLISRFRSCMLHVCTRKGHVSLESIDVNKSSAEFTRDPSTTTWNISGSGEILLSRVDESENYALYGG